jgi:hypothetical protein
MTTADQHLTDDLAALQQLPEAEPEPDALDPTCATTGAGGTPDPSNTNTGPEAESAADPSHAG